MVYLTMLNLFKQRLSMSAISVQFAMCIVQLPWTIKFVCRMIGQSCLTSHAARMIAILLSVIISIGCNVMVLLEHYENTATIKMHKYELITGVILMLMGLMMAEAVLDIHGETILRDMRI